MTNGRNFCLIVASNVLWCTHVSPIYWTLSHLKLQRFILVAYCGLFVVVNWPCFICGATTRWGFATSLVMPCVKFKLDERTMIDGCNLHLIVASNVLRHAHVLPIY